MRLLVLLGLLTMTEMTDFPFIYFIHTNKFSSFLQFFFMFFTLHEEVLLMRETLKENMFVLTGLWFTPFCYET